MPKKEIVKNDVNDLFAPIGVVSGMVWMRQNEGRGADCDGPRMAVSWTGDSSPSTQNDISQNNKYDS